MNGTWGWVCNNGFDTTEAQVVCKQLQFDAIGNATIDMYIYYTCCLVRIKISALILQLQCMIAIHIYI